MKGDGVKGVLRVGVMTDYRYTPRENEKLKELQAAGWLPFVNSNGNTEVHPLPDGIPAVVTVNPDGVRFVPPVGDGLAAVKVARFKWFSTERADVHEQFHQALQWAEDNRIAVLVTPMRFKSKDTGAALGWIRDHYEWKNSWYRLTPEHRVAVENWATTAGVYVCDERGTGCPTCRNCARLTYGRPELDVWGIDLKATGKCPYSCPDCWARAIVKRSGGRIAWDVPKRNTKQKGKKV